MISAPWLTFREAAERTPEDTVVRSDAFQGEGCVYMAYVSMAMDRGVNPGEREGQLPDAAVTESAYRILVHYFPANTPDLTALRDAALAAIADGPAKRNGIVDDGLRPRGSCVRGWATTGNAERLELTLPDAGARTRVRHELPGTAH